MMMRRWLVAVGLVMLTGCPPTPPVECSAGNKDCSCNTDGTCGGGLKCDNAKCVDCPAGAATCACNAAGGCDTGLVCTNNVCAASTCTAGAVDCPCLTGNTCNTGLVCRNGACGSCNADAVGCACPAGTCMSGLVCDAAADTCRAPRSCTELACGANRACMAATATADARCLDSCEGNFRWDSIAGACVAIATCLDAALIAQCTADHRECTPGTPPADATCGDCLVGFKDDAASCVAVATCMTVNASCVTQNRACVAATDHADATCGACLPGFQLNLAVCEPIPAANCTPGAPASQVVACTAQNRTCEVTDGGAACGACLATFIDLGGQCVTEQTCAMLDCAAEGRVCMDIARDGGPPVATGCGACLAGLIEDGSTGDCRRPRGCADITACAASEYCDDGMGLADAVCRPRPCAEANRAQRVIPSNACVLCGGACDREGETGNYWPFTLNNSERCICETLPGYYADTGGNAVAQPCDADGDGFVRVAARDFVESTDPALRTNARCSVRTIDRITLRNEYQQEREILLCDGGDVVRGVGSCASPLTEKLYESDRNDDDAEITLTPMLQSYGSTNGRQLRAAELNPFTRACVSRNADFNDNSEADFTEWQGMPTANDTFSRYSYFLEMHEGFWRPSLTGGAFGTYVVAEKSRCDASFPLTYNTVLDMMGNTLSDGEYWKECTRKRDAQFNQPLGSPALGMDFARFNCEGATCATPPPIAMPPTGSAIPPHGLCDLPASAMPVDGVWRGFGHHSQFKCISVFSTAPTDPNTALGRATRVRSQLYDNVNGNRVDQFNRCHIQCPAGDETCAADCGTGVCTTSTRSPGASEPANPSDPVLTCTPIAEASVLPDEVGFVAVRTPATGGAYVRGCIDEFNEPAYRELCPGYLANPAAIVGQGNIQQFGELICGCGQNYGGPTCDQGCPQMNLFYQDGYDPIRRVGLWMCAQPTTISGTLSFDGGTSSYTLRATTPVGITPTTPLCQGDCDGGYRIR